MHLIGRLFYVRTRHGAAEPGWIARRAPAGGAQSAGPGGACSVR